MRSSNSVRALLVGVVCGVTATVLPSGCGKDTKIVRCLASNCNGCCDDQGKCQAGTTVEQCGSGAATCAPCPTGQMCAQVDQTSADLGGRCVSGMTTGGGGGSTGGGGGASGGGTATGGGSTTGGGTGGGTGTCSATTCANGCCSSTGVCITNTTPSRCGAGGAACTSCMAGNTCVSGACTACTGCIDINTGACMPGMSSNTQCGKGGGFCQACDQAAGQTCQAGTCFGGTSCNAGTCQGCCDGNNCKLVSQQTTAQCGQGSPGAQCVGCTAGATCSMSTGKCEGGSGGGGGGFPLDGGFPFSFCDDQTPCPSGQCCDSQLGILGLCVGQGEACGNSDPNNLVCLLSSLGGSDCTCQSSGTCEP